MDNAQKPLCRRCKEAYARPDLPDPEVCFQCWDMETWLKREGLPTEPRRNAGPGIQWEGPQWLSGNLLEMRLNLALLERVTTEAALRVYGEAEARRLDDLERAMRGAGLAPDETIEAYLARSGWPPTVWETYQQQRERLNEATIAALDRLAAFAREQARLQRQQVTLWLVAVLNERVTQIAQAGPAQLALFGEVA